MHVWMHDVGGSIELTANKGVRLAALIEDNFSELERLYVTGNTGAGEIGDYDVEFFQSGFWQYNGDLIFNEETIEESGNLTFTASGVGFTVLFYKQEYGEPMYFPLPPLSLDEFVEWMFRNDFFDMNFESSLRAGVWEIDGCETSDGETMIGNEVRFKPYVSGEGGDDDDVLDEFTVYGIQLYSATDPDGASKVGMSTYATPVTVEQIYNEHFASAEEYYTFTLYQNGEPVSRDKVLTSDSCIIGVTHEVTKSWNFSVQVSCGEQMKTYSYTAPVSVLDVAKTFSEEFSLGSYQLYNWYENEQVAFSYDYYQLFVENATLTCFAIDAPPIEPSSYKFTYYIDNGNGAVKSSVELDSREIQLKTFAEEYMGLTISEELSENEYAFFEGYSAMNELDANTYVSSEYSIWAIKRDLLAGSYTVTYTFIPTWSYQFETRTQEIYFPCTLENLLYELSDVPTNSYIPDAYLYEIDGEEIDLGKGDWGKLYYYDITLKISPVYYAYVQVGVYDESHKSCEYVSYKPIVLSELWEELGLSKTPTAYSWKVNEQYYYDNALNEPVFLDVGRMGHTILISARTVHLAVTYLDEYGYEMTLGYRGMPEETGWAFSVSAQSAWNETVSGMIEFDDYNWTLYSPLTGEAVPFTDLSTTFSYVALPVDQIEWWDMENAYKTVYKLYGERKA